MKKVLTIGGAMLDTFIMFDDLEYIDVIQKDGELHFIALEEGKKIEVDQVYFATGGGSTNCATSFYNLGYEACSFFKCADDANGIFIQEELKERGIEVIAVLTEDKPTGTSYVVPSPRGNYVILVYRSANTLLEEEELPYKKIEESDIIYITALGGKAGRLLPIICEYAKKHKKMVATNPGSNQLMHYIDDIKKSLPNLDVLITNAREANQLYSSLMQKETDIKSKKRNLSDPQLLSEMPKGSAAFNLRDYIKRMIELGLKTVVITNGAEGVYASDGKKIYFHKSAEAEVISTLGAGDAFGSTFVGWLAADHSIEGALRAGVINSANVIEELDATSHLQEKEELEEQIEDLDPSLLKTFKL